MSIDIPYLSYDKIAIAAANCLARFHPDDTVPVPIEDIIDVGYGLEPVLTPNLEARFSTVAFLTHDLKEIRVDDFVYRKQSYRLRFSYAHELGHLILHQGVYEQLVFKTPGEWKMAMESLGDANYRRLEWQADAFAGLVLVPPQPFRQKFVEIAATLAKVKKSFNDLPKDAQDYSVMGLARIFGVATGTIWFRLKDEGLI